MSSTASAASPGVIGTDTGTILGGIGTTGSDCFGGGWDGCIEVCG